MDDKLTVSFSEKGECDLMEIEGGISYSNTPLLQAETDKALKKKRKNIIIDFSKVIYISSAGLRIFLKFQKSASKEGKSLALCGLNEFTSSVFKVSGIDTIFNIQPDQDKAAQSFLKK